MIIDIMAGKAKPQKENRKLTTLIGDTIVEINNTYASFNEATDSYEIESLIFRLNELERRYSYLIKYAKLNKIAATGRRGSIWK